MEQSDLVLTTARVEEIFRDCLFKETEDTSTQPMSERLNSSSLLRARYLRAGDVIQVPDRCDLMMVLASMHRREMWSSIGIGVVVQLVDPDEPENKEFHKSLELLGEQRVDFYGNEWRPELLLLARQSREGIGPWLTKNK